MKRILSVFSALIFVIGCLSGMTLAVAAEEETKEEAPKLTADEAFTSTHWKAVHRWDFEGDLTDSVGGASVTPLTCSYFSEPTYKNGKIYLNGFQAYTFDEALTFDKEDGTSGLRVDILARMDFNTAAHSARRIFGCNIENQRTAGLVYINIPGAQYGSCSFALSTTSPAFGSFVMIPDQSKFSTSEENFYTFIYYNGMLYHYADGVLIGMQENGQGGAFIFTDFLGCSFVGDDMNYNFVGEIDFLQVSVFDPQAENEAITVPPETDPPITSAPEGTETEPTGTTVGTESQPDSSASVNTSDVPTDTDSAKTPAPANSWLLPVAIAAVVIVAVVAAIVAVKKKKS